MSNRRGEAARHGLPRLPEEMRGQWQKLRWSGEWRQGRGCQGSDAVENSRESSRPQVKETEVETRLRRRGREGSRDEEGLHLTRGWPVVGWKQAAPAAYPKSCISGNQSLSVVKLC